LYATVRGQIRLDTPEKIDFADKSDFFYSIFYFLLYLELYYGNLKTIQAVKETADYVTALK
jgi:hypothetical protein